MWKSMRIAWPHGRTMGLKNVGGDKVKACTDHGDVILLPFIDLHGGLAFFSEL